MTDRSPLLAALRRTSEIDPERRDVIAVKRVRRDEILPLSFAQRRLWFLDTLEPESRAYTIARVWHLTGRLDIDALEGSLGEMVQRHEALRTSFPSIDDEPRQEISSPAPIAVQLVDLSGLGTGEREAAVERSISASARQPFDLAQGPLMRFTLVRLSEQDHRLLVACHHIIMDGWSLRLFERELAELYTARMTGRTASPPDLPIQYADYALWQRRWLQGETLETQLAYWKEQLAGAPDLLSLPTDRPRPAVQSYRGAVHTMMLPLGLAEGLENLGRREDATLFMVLLAAFQTLLYRLSGEKDITVGSPIAGRNMVEVEHLIGIFINTLVLRSTFEDGSTFREVLSQVRQTALGAYEHQDLPFEKLVEELRPARHMSHSPLFQVMLVLQNQPDAPASFHDLKVRREYADVGSSRFDVCLYVQPAGNGLELTFEYSTDLFDGSTIARWAGHFERLLEGIVADPGARVGELPLLSDEERHRLLVEWNNTEAAYAREATLHGLFEAQAARTPDAAALEFDGDRLSYGELNRRANRLANHLRDLGVAAEVFVAVCIERSAEMVVALLAVLKAGGAYVPLDPSYPRNRLEYMLSDSGAGVLLTQRRLAGRLSGHGANEVYIDTFDWSDPAHSEDNPVSGVTAEGLAYVMYTSGSTGDPNGVLCMHRATVNRLSWMWETFPFTDGDLCCHKTSLNFGDSIAELFGPLLRGVCTVVVGQDDIRDPRALVSCLAAHGVTRVVVVPSVLRVILDAHAELSRILPKLRYWVTSGEALTKDLAERFKAAYPAAVLLNFYGSTEVGNDSTGYDTRSGTSFSNVPIGRPIANTKLYVLDEFMEPVPIGVSGELYIGGEGLARGYLKRPELTAERFVENPFESGQRVYRTGDLVRYRSDGNLEIAGRIDHQVKIRGVRIELGEIEAMLCRHADVAEAVVALRGDDPAEQRLVAYYVPRGEPAPEAGELRALLKERLPDYMMPSSIMTLDAVPLTPSGKVDRKALPEPGMTRQEVGGGYVAPRTPTEQALAEIWAEVLGLDKIGAHDDFFDLGGHSFLAVRLVSKIEAKMGQSIPLVELFQGRTIEHIARIVGEEHGGESSSAIVAIQPNGSNPPVFAAGSHPKYVDVARRLGLNQPFYRLDVYGLQSECLAEGRKVYSRVEDMAARFIEEIRAVQPVGPYFLGGGCEGGVVAFEMALQLQRQGEQIACLVIWVVEAPAHFGGAFGRRTAFIRAVNQLRGVLRRGSVRGASLRELVVLIKHEYIEYRIFRAVGHYVPSERYRGKLTIVRAVEQAPSDSEDVSMGWTEFGTEGAEVHKIPGTHQTWLETYADEFGDLLKTSLAAARRG